MISFNFKLSLKNKFQWEKNILSFKTSDTVACGARPAHLSNAEITLSEKTDEGLITNWDQIYIEKLQNHDRL